MARRAVTQVEEADRWWRANRAAAPDSILEELERALVLILSQPAAGVPAGSVRLGGVRRVLLSKVGYFLYYRLAPRRREIQVLAFWHARRGTRPPL
jgi:plasmid stabilization system protein ParE